MQLFESASTETISGPFDERGPAIQAQILVAGGENTGKVNGKTAALTASVILGRARSIMLWSSTLCATR